MKARSLRAQILWWLFPGLGLLCAADAVDTYFKAVRQVDDSYDRVLYASALAISERVSFAEAQPTVELPPVALEILDTPAQERVFYRVAYRRGDGPELDLTGYPDLPRPRAAAEHGPSFREDRYRGDLVRIAELRRYFPTDPPSSVLVQVAETVHGRERLARAVVLRALGWEILIVTVAAGVVAFGVRRGLRPLASVSGEVARRSATDLTALALERVPREARTLVDAVNDLMRRLRATLEGQERFIADASHALRTPLAVLHSEAELGLRQEDPAAMRRSLQRLHEQSRSTTHLCSQLLAMARAGHSGGQREPPVVDLHAVARDACSTLVPAAVERDVDLGFEGDGPAPARAREHEVRELIGNLVDNAVRHGARPGAVTVSAGRGADGQAWLAVEDDGPGIPAGQRAAVLEPFHRLPGTPGEGAGLGLAIVHEIAQAHGAELRLVDGRGGRGLRVELVFPAVG